jgi:hypothetical protein
MHGEHFYLQEKDTRGANLGTLTDKAPISGGSPTTWSQKKHKIQQPSAYIRDMLTVAGFCNLIMHNEFLAFHAMLPVRPSAKVGLSKQYQEH